MDESVTWRGKAAKIANAAMRPFGIRLIRASSLDEHIARGYLEVRLGESTFRCDPSNIGFWTAAEAGQWEPELFAVLRHFLTPASVCYDIGAWIGPATLYAARHCRVVYAFEPDPLACAVLLRNITKNELGNTRAFNVAVAAADGPGVISSFGDGLGDSMSSLLESARRNGFQCPVTTVTLNTVVARLSCEPPTFIKMDIEGGEFDLLPAIRNDLERWRPILFLSLHACYLPREDREAKLSALTRSLDFYESALVNDKPYSLEALRETLLSWDYPGGADFGPVLFLPGS
jgi:FkbM family methyltransferase